MRCPGLNTNARTINVASPDETDNTSSEGGLKLNYDLLDIIIECACQ
jgi:hypothetical protein